MLLGKLSTEQLKLYPKNKCVILFGNLSTEQLKSFPNLSNHREY